MQVRAIILALQEVYLDRAMAVSQGAKGEPAPLRAELSWLKSSVSGTKLHCCRLPLQQDNEEIS